MTAFDDLEVLAKNTKGTGAGGYVTLFQAVGSRLKQLESDIANAELTDGGYLRIVHARVPAFDLGKTLEQNARSELRIDYGVRYWALMDKLGTSAAHALEVD